jgi:serine/threonine-protein kinase
MTTPSRGETLLLPQGSQSSPGGRESAALPTDLLGQSASRLRALALLYAFVFLVAGYLPLLVIPEERARAFSSFIMWGPGAISIADALLLSVLIQRARLSPSTVTILGLVFEVISSYGIAAAEFLHPMAFLDSGWFGLSWVAVWTLLFTIVVPTKPRAAVIAALSSVSAVPVMVSVSIAVYSPSFRPTATQFFFALVLPYVLVVLMAYVGARVIYSLGTEVRRARELGSYRLVERLGQGGMGEVWRAEHRMLARPAAVKLIRPSRLGDVPHWSADDARRRFEREAQAIARLYSPHTVELFDFGVASDGAFFYVMELLDGFDAETLVSRFGPVPSARAIYILRQICHSLSEAESCGLVHRDIKPANIFLCRYGEDCDFVKVLDFGIVKATRDTAETGVMLTQEASVRGTPAFIAPEQALGGADVDGRADIYATGCVAYWLITGQLVFTGETPMALLLQHANTPPIPASVRTELPVPPGLDEVILSCLEKDPTRRPQSARALSRRLDAIRDAGEWTQDDAREWWARHHPAGT